MDVTYVHEYELLTLARILLAEHALSGDPAMVSDAMQLLDRLERPLSPVGGSVPPSRWPSSRRWPATPPGTAIKPSSHCAWPWPWLSPKRGFG